MTETPADSGRGWFDNPSAKRLLLFLGKVCSNLEKKSDIFFQKCGHPELTHIKRYRGGAMDEESAIR